MRSVPVIRVAGVLAVILTACTSAAPAASVPTPTAVLPPNTISTEGQPAHASAVPPPTLTAGAPKTVPQAGTFRGQLSDGSQTYSVAFWIDGCGEVDEVCGAIEYADPAHPEFTRCGPELVLKGEDGDADVFEQHPAVGADRCPPSTLEFKKRTSTPWTLDITPYGDGGASTCCHGSVTLTAEHGWPEIAPRPPSIAGLSGPLVTSVLTNPTTQFSVADSTNAYFPQQGYMIGVPLKGGDATEFALRHDAVGSLVDPKAVALVGDALWIGRGTSKELEQVDPGRSRGDGPTIPLPHAPYALAADGTILWVTSLDDSVVMAVDMTTQQVVATVSVPKPAGVAVGGGSVWVVEHADNKIARIDRATRKLTDEIALGNAGNDRACGSCGEQVIYALGSAWTANDLGRSITRVDGRSLKATTIPTSHRVWSVAAYGGSVYGSQFEEVDGYIDRSVGGLVRVDPQTNKAEELSAPGVRGVAALGDDLWLIVPGRLSDIVMSYTTP